MITERDENWAYLAFIPLILILLSLYICIRSVNDFQQEKREECEECIILEKKASIQVSYFMNKYIFAVL